METEALTVCQQRLHHNSPHHIHQHNLVPPLSLHRLHMLRFHKHNHRLHGLHLQHQTMAAARHRRNQAPYQSRRISNS